MHQIDKFLLRIDRKRRVKLQKVLKQLAISDLGGLDAKKLKGKDEFYRVRVGDIRIIYSLTKSGVKLEGVEFKGDKTYNF